MDKEEIKATYSMRDILARYGLAEPNRAGFISCPFHKEDTASMKIYEKDCHCFGCGFNGDIFTFVQKMDGLTFQEAFKMLGGSNDSSFSARLKICQAQKKREMQRKAEEKLKQKREINYSLMHFYRKYLDKAELFSQAWADLYNALQYQEYLWEILNDPNECYQAIGHTSPGGGSDKM